MDWWIWLIAGFGLLALELFAPTGFFLFVVGLSGLIVGGLVYLGIGGPAWLQWVICAALTLVLLPVIRKAMPGNALGYGGPAMREVEGEEILISADIEPGKQGQGELRGTIWKIRNVGTIRLEAGSTHRVVRVDGLTLEVKA